MEKLTIRFYHNIPINDNELSMTEYFIPYEKKLLLSLVAEKNTIAEWDILLEENNNIRLSSENNYCTYFYQEENNDKWIDGGSDNKKTSLWDYLAEVNTIYNLYKCFKEEKLSIKTEQLEQLANVNMLSRIYFDMAKIDLSILAKSSVNIGNPELEKVIVEYYDEIHRVINKKNNREFVYNRQQPQILMRYSELSVLVQEINDVVDIFLSEEESSRLSYKDAIHLIKIKFNKMISLIGKKYVIRKRFLKRLKAVHNYVFDENMIFKMTVCSNEFDTQRVSMFEHILYNVTKYNNKIPEIGDIDFREKIHELANYFMKTISIYGKTTVGKNVLEKYNAESGCFSIMHECGGKSYFAFSGAREYKYSAMREQFNILAENVMQKVFGVYVKNGNVRIRGNSIDWAFLTDEVLRYYPFGVGVEEKGEYISAVRLKDDLPSLNWVKDKGKVGTSYGCCERKILAFSKNNKEKIFFSRWAPCFKCRPAMEEKNIRTFALCKDFKEWKETHRYELKEYKVKKTYSVVCMLE